MDALAVVPVALVITLSVYGTYTLESRWILIATGILISMIVAKAVKKNMKPNEITLRPSNGEECGMLNGKAGDIGMPSAHATAMACFATMMFMWSGKLDTRSMLAILLAVAVIVERVVVKCHTVLQVAAGSVIGIVLGAILGYSFMVS